MPDTTQASIVRRFGTFEINPESEELRKNGMRLRLSGQPFQVLAVLIERAGDVVTREELHSKLWPADTFVDFDHGLNNAVARIREVLDDSPDTPRYVETIPRRGYRFIAPVSSFHSPRLARSAADSTITATRTMTSPTASNPFRTPEKRSVFTRPIAWFGGTVVIAALAVALVSYRASVRSAAQPAIKSLAVLPLKNLSGDTTQEYFSDGMTEAVIRRLCMIRGLRVISRTSVMRFKDTRMSVPEIAKMLAVDAIVEGSVIREGERVRVYAQLIRGTTDEHFWSETYDQELRDVLALQSEVAQSIARRVEVTVSGEEQVRLVAARPVSPDVYESYLKGEFALAKESRAELEPSVAHFEDAIRKDPTFAPAYVGLANAHNSLGSTFFGAPVTEERQKAISAARKALELDAELSDAHVILAELLQKEWQWAEAGGECKRALELKPNNAVAHQRFANWLLSQGRTEEALAWARRGRELDPLAPSSLGLGWILFQTRHYDEAIHELRSMAAVRPDDASAQWWLGFALIGNGQAEEAIPVLVKTASISRRSPGSLELLATAYAHSGRRTQALRIIDELKQQRRTTYVPASAFLNPYLALGDYDQAFVWFEHAYQEKSAILQWLKVHPFFDPVREDPRFKDLVRRVGLN